MPNARIRRDARRVVLGSYLNYALKHYKPQKKSSAKPGSILESKITSKVAAKAGGNNSRDEEGSLDVYRAQSGRTVVRVLRAPIPADDAAMAASVPQPNRHHLAAAVVAASPLAQPNRYQTLDGSDGKAAQMQPNILAQNQPNTLPNLDRQGLVAERKLAVGEAVIAQNEDGSVWRSATVIQVEDARVQIQRQNRLDLWILRQDIPARLKFIEEPQSPASELETKLSVGLDVEATDILQSKKWLVATVLQIAREMVKIHWSGWDDQWDEWILIKDIPARIRLLKPPTASSSPSATPSPSPTTPSPSYSDVAAGLAKSGPQRQPAATEAPGPGPAAAAAKSDKAEAAAAKSESPSPGPAAKTGLPEVLAVGECYEGHCKQVGWKPVKIIAVGVEGKVQIHWEEYSARWDEWISKADFGKRLRPCGSSSPPAEEEKAQAAPPPPPLPRSIPAYPLECTFSLRSFLEGLYQTHGWGVNSSFHRTHGCITPPPPGSDNLFGELLPSAINHMFASDHLNVGDADTLYELGGGFGRLVHQAFLGFPRLTNIVGVELEKNRYMAGRNALKNLQMLHPQSMDFTENAPASSGAGAGKWSDWCRVEMHHHPKSGVKLPHVRVLEWRCGDLFDTMDEIHEADVITCFAALPLQAIPKFLKLIQKIKNGARLAFIPRYQSLLTDKGRDTCTLTRSEGAYQFWHDPFANFSTPDSKTDTNTNSASTTDAKNTTTATERLITCGGCRGTDCENVRAENDRIRAKYPKKLIRSFHSVEGTCGGIKHECSWDNVGTGWVCMARAT